MECRLSWNLRGKRMVIRELYMKNFGKFHNTRILLQNGINIIYGENEVGKSTIHAFIRGMLFGIEKQRGRASKNDTYSRYEPWENPAYYAGVMRFECHGKLFRLERNFEKRDKWVKFICETDGEELSVEHGDLEIILDGLNESTYDNTISIGQLKSQTDNSLALSVRNFMSNYEETGDGEVDVGCAVESLKKKRKELQKEKVKMNEKLRERMREAELQKSFVFQELQEKEMKKEAEEDRQKKIQSRLHQLREQQRHHQRKEEQDKRRQENVRERQRTNVGEDSRKPESIKDSRKQYGTPMIILLILLIFSGLSGIAISSNLVVRLLIGILSGACIWILWYVYNQRKESVPREKEEESSLLREETILPKEELLELYKSIEELERQERELEWSILHLKQEVQEKRILLGNLEELLEEMNDSRSEMTAVDRKIDSIQMAIDTILEISLTMSQEMGNRLEEEMSGILDEITEGRYDRVKADEDLGITIHTYDRILRLEQLSKGTVDQVYFALRMAVGRLFWKSQPMPVLFDESFAMYDEKRLRRTLEWLAGSGGQILIFTCHRREEELLIREQIPYYMVLEEGSVT
jgi:uncharacterized protein YhaN